MNYGAPPSRPRPGSRRKGGDVGTDLPVRLPQAPDAGYWDDRCATLRRDASATVNKRSAPPGVSFHPELSSNVDILHPAAPSYVVVRSSRLRRSRDTSTSDIPQFCSGCLAWAKMPTFFASRALLALVWCFGGEQ